MPSANLLALLDDVAALTKLAATKTAPVLGDDLAVNAEQLSGGIKPDRELAVVWQVFKGSLLNKFILVPVALAFSYFAPFMIPIMLILGALYLLFEGGEKILHALFHRQQQQQETAEFVKALEDENVDLVEFEKDKIKGAIVTDFVLSAEIIIIALGAIADQPFEKQAIVLSLIGLALTIGVYGIVALIVKLDDIGLAMLKDASKTTFAAIKRGVGKGLLHFANGLMKFLSVAGVLAMLLVGVDILAHQFHLLESIVHTVEQLLPAISWLLNIIAKLGLGAVLGVAIAAVLSQLQSLLNKA